MAKEGIVVDGINLFEKYGYFDAWLEIRLRVIAELSIGKLMVNFLPRHICGLISELKLEMCLK